MTPAKFATYIRLRTRTNANTFPDAEILEYANIIKDDIAKEITKVNEDYFVIELVRNLEAGKRSYSFPTDVLNQIKYTEVCLDGTNWQTLDEFDLNSYRKPTDEASILAEFAGKKPKMELSGNQLMIYSGETIQSVSGGLKMRAVIYPADLSSLAGTTDMAVAPSKISFGVPRQLHYIWATKVIVEYKGSKEKPIPLTEKEASVDKDLTLAINALKGGNLERSITATIPDPFNNGQDL